jgi:uncharacterized protein (DUF697 family)
MKLAYAFVAGIIGFIPGGAVILIALEVVMFYHMCHTYKHPVLGEGLVFAGTLISISFFFKAIAQALHVVPIIGQFANSLVAFFVVLGLGYVFENYIRHKANTKAE